MILTVCPNTALDKIIFIKNGRMAFQCVQTKW